MNVSDQRRQIESALGELPAQRVYVFGMLMLERMVAMCRQGWPVGMPTRNVQYDLVADALSRLWARSSSSEGLVEVARRASEWRPLSREGVVLGEDGADWGYFISESIARIALLNCDDADDGRDLAMWLSDAMQGMLLTVPDDFDYSVPVNRMELRVSTNAALIAEFDAERLDIGDLLSPSSGQADRFSVRAREVGREIGLVLSRRKGLNAD